MPRCRLKLVLQNATGSDTLCTELLSLLDLSLAVLLELLVQLLVLLSLKELVRWNGNVVHQENPSQRQRASDAQLNDSEHDPVAKLGRPAHDHLFPSTLRWPRLRRQGLVPFRVDDVRGGGEAQLLHVRVGEDYRQDHEEHEEAQEIEVGPQGEVGLVRVKACLHQDAKEPEEQRPKTAHERADQQQVLLRAAQTNMNLFDVVVRVERLEHKRLVAHLLPLLLHRLRPRDRLAHEQLRVALLFLQLECVNPPH
mmetsp:Transcript_24974/g.44417  ORF Transcript_24974/g.44417 Transcript_24974/m.44417 type:complete len:253 (+) Transcript_24974:490-1248(+)